MQFQMKGQTIMRRLMTIFAMAGALSGLALAETWSGTLLDATCMNRHHGSRSCDARTKTTAFLLDVNGTKYRLDGKSNDEARSVMEARADKASNPDATKAVPVQAQITGRMRSNGKIRAEIISVQ
jgi:hypothetical protein